MLSRILIGLVAAGAAVLGAPGVASAEPEPGPPPPPNANSLAPVKPSDFALEGGEMYAFTVPGDITCVMSRGTGTYGCSGAIPAAPNGANTVTGTQQGAPGFANADRPLYIFDTPPNPLPVGSRINFRNVACGTDGTNTFCNNNFDGGGFVLSPAGSFIIEPNNPLVLNNGQGRSPYFN